MPLISSTGVEATTWLLVALSLSFLMARCYVRLCILRSSMNVSDYLVISGWISCLAGATLQTTIYSLQGFAPGNSFSEGHIVSPETNIVLSKMTYAITFFFDIGLYLPKFSLIAFYYHWISIAFPRLRIALYFLTFYVGAACLSSLLTSLLWCNPINQNWATDFNVCKNFLSEDYLIIIWSLNISSDVFIFILPFFLLPNLRRQKHSFYAAMIAFLLGAITILASTARFLVFIFLQEVSTINTLFTIEFNTSLIITCIPSLKSLWKSPFFTRYTQAILPWRKASSGSDQETTLYESSASMSASRNPAPKLIVMDIEHGSLSEFLTGEEDSSQEK